MVENYTLYGYFAISALGLATWWVVRESQKKKDAQALKKKAGSAKWNKQNQESVHSGEDQGKEKEQKKKARKEKSTKPPPAEAATPPSYDDPEDEVDNKEFARQLQNAKSGTIQSSRPQAAARQKSVKQSQAKSAPAVAEAPKPSAAQSSSDATEGDNLSAANSPELGATHDSKLGRNDVSDMLEQSAGGPSVLRITEPSSTQPRKEKKAQVVESAETKKQRQNRKKAEAKKIAREEEEKERRVLLEKQRRTAREAEGRAAKDGSTYTAAKAPANTVWKGETKPASGPDGDDNEKVQLLDTYDPSSKPVVSPVKAPTNGVSYEVLPSEEEQMRLIEEDSAWATVKTKKPKKNTKENAPIEVKAPVKEKANTGSYAAATAPNNKSAKKQTGFQGLAVENGHDSEPEEAVEAEWEV